MGKTIEEFFQEYEHPAIQSITVGFSGIDPIPKSFNPVVISDKTDTGEDIHAYIDQKISQQLVKAHEELPDLLGGNDNEHYHLTEAEYNGLYRVLTVFSNPNGANTLTTDEYDKAAAIIAVLYPDEDTTTPQFPTHEELNGLLGGESNGHYHLTESEVENLGKLITALINSSGEVELPSDSHEDLQGLQGGTNGEHYHLTAEEYEKVQNISDTPAQEGGVTDHEELTNLQGGTNGEHYHLTQAEVDKLNDYPAYDSLNIPSKHEDLSDIQGGTNGEYYHLTESETEKINKLITALIGTDGEVSLPEGGQSEGVTSHEALEDLLGGAANAHYHLTEAELQKVQAVLTDLYPNGADEPVYPSSGEGGSAVTVVDNLTSTSSENALSANQGRVLKTMIDAVTDNQDYILTTEEFSNAVDEKIAAYNSKNKIIDCGEITNN